MGTRRKGVSWELSIWILFCFSWVSIACVFFLRSFTLVILVDRLWYYDGEEERLLIALGDDWGLVGNSGG